MAIFIHPTAVVETNDIGDGTSIGPFCYVGERVKIGRNCKFVAHCSLGGLPQYKVLPELDEEGLIIVGNNVEIREFVTINLPTKKLTYIGDNSYLMAHVHVPHDAYLSHDSFLVVGTTLGGFTRVGKFCYLGMKCTTHQLAKLGDFCLIGANTFFKGESPPGIVWVGIPARPLRLNTVGLDRFATQQEREKIICESTQFIHEYNNSDDPLR